MRNLFSLYDESPTSSFADFKSSEKLRRAKVSHLKIFKIFPQKKKTFS